MRPRWYLLVLAVTGACARHVEPSTAPEEWIPTLNEPSRRAAAIPTSLPTPQATPREACTLLQMLAMRVSGMTDDQIRKACE